MSPRVAITGASGFIGGHLLAEADRRGLRVTAFARHQPRQLGAHAFRPWSLDQAPPVQGLALDYAVHLAHDFDAETGAQRTIAGTLRAVDAFRAAGATRQVFFSSISSGEHAISLYGRTKLAIEKLLADQSDITIIRPGLVLGDGGIYGRIRQWVRRFPVVPLPDGGHGDMPVIRIEELCRQTLTILASPDAPRDLDLYEPTLKTLRTLVREEAGLSGRRLLIVPIPSRLLLVVLGILEKLRFPLPVTSDNLNGFLANQSRPGLKERRHIDVV
jgi:nucleoside-diphosphate-sugar epimerase